MWSSATTAWRSKHDGSARTMLTGGAIVSLIAASGWLFLNWRALESRGLSFERKMQFAVAWIVIIAGLAFLLGRVA